MPRVIANPHSAVELTMTLEAIAYCGVALGIALMNANKKIETNISLFTSEPQYEKNTQY
jgi:hypothetical protein